MDGACGEGAAGGGLGGVGLLARGGGRARGRGHWAALPHAHVVRAIPSGALSVATSSSQPAEGRAPGPCH